MTKLQDQILRIIQQNAARKVGLLANRYVRASPAEKEAIQAGIQIERWLSETCQDCLN
jgi:hypothetical protein